MPNYIEIVSKVLLGLLLLGGLSTACEPQTESEAEAVDAQATPGQSTVSWRWPAEVPAGPAGEQIRRGEDLIAQTSRYLGPEAEKPELRLAGNRLSCSNCHHQHGKQANAMGFVGIAHRYPSYYAPLDREVSLSERISACFERSLNGQPLPAESPELAAMVAYMSFLSEAVPPDQPVPGVGLPEIALLERPADISQGQKIYNYSCASCHGPQGLGLPKDPAQPAAGYTFPPVAGPDSYSQSSNLARLIVSARYIKANMPLGRPVLSAAEAFDVAAYINSLERPALANAGQDYPNPATRPVDVPYGPYPNPALAMQHKLGPYGPLLQP